MNSQPQSFAKELGDNVKAGSVWYMIFGVFLVLGGIAAVARPLHAGVALSLIVGWVLIINGIVAGANALMSRNAGGFLWRVLVAVLYVAAGIMVLRNPVGGLAAITFILGVMLVLGGIMRLFLSSALSGIPGNGLIILGAIVSIIVGVMVLAKLPDAGEFVVGTLIGIDFIVTGISLFLFGNGARKMGGAISGS